MMTDEVDMAMTRAACAGAPSPRATERNPGKIRASASHAFETVAHLTDGLGCSDAAPFVLLGPPDKKSISTAKS